MTTDAQSALAQVREALEAMRGDWLGDGFTKLRRSQIVAVLNEQEAEVDRLRAAVQHEADCVETYRAQVETMIRERDDLRRQLAEAEQDARRYRDWLRGGANIPPESTRWARWEVRHWDGRYWNTLFAEALDTSIDAAMDLTRPAEAHRRGNGPHPASGGAAMSKIIHAALDVRGFLKNARFPRDYTRMFKHHDGRVMTPEEARDQLFDELARGHELIPVGACDDFDYSAGGGCRGHDRPDSEAMGFTRPAEEA